jgi:alginate O-acetyltransferase complex protein AlgI
VYQAGAVPDAVFVELTRQRLAMVTIGMLVVLFPATYVTGRLLERKDTRWATPARLGVVGLLAPYAAVLVAAGTFSPFLYFQF